MEPENSHDQNAYGHTLTKDYIDMVVRTRGT